MKKVSETGNISISKSLKEKVWWDYMPEDLRELLRESTLLVDRVGKWNETFHDYAFIVFPAAKAYEGYLKTLFLDLGFINEETFYGKRFRIGKALNPALEKRFRDESIYDQIVKFCGGKNLANSLWDTWKTCRNLLFHWFPNEKNAISYKEARERVEKIIKAMDLAFQECKISKVEE
jgi:hypothetical protein